MNRDKNNNVEIDANDNKNYSSEYRMEDNNLGEFDLAFLKLENDGVNKVYSPLAIKYALAMLNDGTDGDSNGQIKAVIGDYKAKRYTNSNNLSLANAFFVRDSFKDAAEIFTNFPVSFNVSISFAPQYPIPERNPPTSWKMVSSNLPL